MYGCIKYSDSSSFFLLGYGCSFTITRLFYPFQSKNLFRLSLSDRSALFFYFLLLSIVPTTKEHESFLLG